MHKLNRVAISIVAALTLCAISASAQTFKFRSTGFVTPNAINNSGAIAGYFCCGFSFGFDGPQGEFHAFSLQNSRSTGQSFKMAEPFRAQDSFATGIAPNGDLVGGFCNAGISCAEGNAMHGYLFTNSSNATRQIDVPGAAATLVGGINRAGQIVGMFCAATTCSLSFAGDSHGFLLDHIGGTFTKINFPNAVGTGATGINDNGEIVGNYDACKTQIEGTSALTPCVFTQGHGFYLIGDTYTSIDPPGSQATEVLGINNFGEIVGTYLDSRNKTHGFLFSSGAFTIVDFPGAAVTVVNGVNDQGQIVGYAETGSVIQNFIGTPQ